MASQKKALLFKAISIRTILPSVVTLFAFMAGLTSVKFALSGRWELAVAAVIAAGIFDGLDGTVARLLKSTSRFGAELDSLSDVVAFGVAPAIILYLFILDDLDRLGWAVALIYASAMALRLARFNARLDDDSEVKKTSSFLTGVPAPMGAGLLLAPLMLEFAYGSKILDGMAMLVAAYVIFIALLMVSTLPTISLKALRVPREWFIPALLVFVTVVAGLFAKPWVALLFIGAAYLIGMPFTYAANKKREAQKMRS